MAITKEKQIMNIMIKETEIEQDWFYQYHDIESLYTKLENTKQREINNWIENPTKWIMPWIEVWMMVCKTIYQPILVDGLRPN